jgi:excisionase family DNA binding protein
MSASNETPGASLPLDRPGEHWLTIQDACALLGVDQTTLRRWSDAGRIPVFRTVGGHRRYAESDIRAMIHQGRQSHSTREPGSHSDPPPPYQMEYLQGARDRQWFSAFEPESLDKLRIHGRELVELAMRYASTESNSPERARLVTEGQRIGVIYGQRSHAAGLTIGETVEAFLYFRFPVIFAAGNLIDRSTVPADRVTRVFADVSQFMDRVLLATVRARETAATRSAHSADSA